MRFKPAQLPIILCLLHAPLALAQDNVAPGPQPGPQPDPQPDLSQATEAKYCAHCGQAALDQGADPDKKILHCTDNPVVALQDELFLGALGITAWGVYYWDWFTQGFHFKDEHGFRQGSSTGGADKVGHFFDTFILADFLNWRLLKMGFSRHQSALTGALSAMALMTWLEIGDGTGPYGFSLEDLLADLIGAAASYALAMLPQVDDVVDFRIQYWPTSEYFGSGEMVADYSGMKFLMALKLSGIKPVMRTPFRFIEFHGGYYSRGFRTFDANEEKTTRAVYVGVGLDVYELLRPILPQILKQPFKTALTYYQIPFASFEVHAWKAIHTEPTPADTEERR
ncbi:MAG: DUF2279 domain-containing protein [Myxococcota bacterium]|nr:DUF2279 domain-containing protein [Myxococcota bacterium]